MTATALPSGDITFEKFDADPFPHLSTAEKSIAHALPYTRLYRK